MLGSKIKTILTDGTAPLREGMYNYNNPQAEIELLAKERAKACTGCRYFKKEPIDFLRVKDQRIRELSEMSCGKCGCLLPYKTRQSIKPCSRWDR